MDWIVFGHNEVWGFYLLRALVFPSIDWLWLLTSQSQEDGRNKKHFDREKRHLAYVIIGMIP